MTLRVLLLAVLCLGFLAACAQAAEWFVSPAGAPSGTGHRDSPWDIASALEGKQAVKPGDTIWLLGGLYKHPFVNGGQGYPVLLAGRAEAPIKVRGVPGERVTIDGGLAVNPPADHLWIQDLEITVSEPRPDHPVGPGSFTDLHRPAGGLNINAGSGCKYLNLVLHDNSGGVGFWREATDSEVYGCLIYDNGWAATDRGHGHAIYTQNREGKKVISDCIMTRGYGFTMHAYGEQGFVEDFLLQGNICYDGGTFLVGGLLPSRGIRVRENFLYGLTMQIGYYAPYNEDCEVWDNVVVGGDLLIKNYRNVVSRGNLVLSKEGSRPSGARVVLRPNKYDPKRANLAIYNWERKPAVAVDLSRFLRPGERYQFRLPTDFYGAPALAGSYDGTPVAVPMGGEFAAFVVLREARPGEA